MTIMLVVLMGVGIRYGKRGSGIMINKKITDMDLLTDSNSRYGDEMPWDENINHCVTVGNDNDLYEQKNDVRYITFY